MRYRFLVCLATALAAAAFQAPLFARDDETKPSDAAQLPIAQILNPPPGQEVAPLQALILVKINEQYVGERYTFLIFLDGRPVEARWDPDALAFSYLPRRMLLPGQHSVKVFMTQDNGQNVELVADATFRVAGYLETPPPQPGSVFDLGGRIPHALTPMGRGTVTFFRLSGRASVSMALGQITGPGATLRQEPENETVFDLSGHGRDGDTTYDFRLYLTTEESRYYQPRNRYSFKVDEGGRRGFAVGDTTPRLSPLTIDGMRLTGIHAWGTLGEISVNMAEGDVRQATATKLDRDGHPISRGLGERRLWVARVGLWEDRSFSLGLNYLSGKENRSDMPNSGTPGDNVVESVDMTLRTSDRRGAIQGVFAESDFDSHDPARQDISNAQAGQIEGTYVGGGHNLRVRWELIEPGFMSFGLPYLQVDREGWVLEDRYSFGRGAMTGRVYWEQHQNNLDGSLDFTTTTTRYGGQAMWRLGSGGTSIQAGYSQQNRSNNVPSGAAGLIDESTITWNVGMTHSFDFWGGTTSLRADLRRSTTDNDANPSNNMRRKGITINLTSRWTGGFQIDAAYSSTLGNYTELGLSSDLHWYSVRAAYVPGGRNPSVWTRWEEMRANGEGASVDSDRNTIEIGMRWTLGEDLTLEASLSVVDYDDSINQARNFKERMYRIILSQMLQ